MKEVAVADAFDASPFASDRDVAEHLGVSDHKVVGAIRKRLGLSDVRIRRMDAMRDWFTARPEARDIETMSYFRAQGWIVTKACAGEYRRRVGILGGETNPRWGVETLVISCSYCQTSRAVDPSTIAASCRCGRRMDVRVILRPAPLDPP